MGLRFQKKVKILPGVTLNFSKRGVSTTVGTRGFRTTIGHGKTTTTVGIPGTGLSYTTVEKTRVAAARKQEPSTTLAPQKQITSIGSILIWLIVVGFLSAVALLMLVAIIGFVAR